jgi:hypothetical protein
VTDVASAPIAPATPSSGLLALIVISSALLLGMLALWRKQQA